MEEDFSFSELLDDAATGYERAHADVSAGRLAQIDVEAIDTLWDAKTIRADLLPLLAYAMGVNLFEADYWSVDQQREWIDNNWFFLAKRGTLPAARMALAASGYKVVETITPPQGFYASPDFSKEELDAWIRQMPEIRITFAERAGVDNGQWFANDGFAEDLQGGFAGYDDGPLLRGRFAFIRRNGVDTPLVSLTEERSTETQKATDFERQSIPGLSTLGFFANESAADDEQFVAAAEVEATIITLRVDHSYDHERSELYLNTIDIGLEPLDVRHRVTSDIGDAGESIFASDTFKGNGFAVPDEGALMLADSVYLHDPKVATPMMSGVSFANVDRVGIQLKTAELMIDLGTYEEGPACFASETFATECYALDHDNSHIDRAIRAVEASRAHLDQILVRFDVMRPLQVLDTVTEATLVGDWVPNHL